jgi:adenosylcobinamide-GDP ribazoletransferase
MRGWLGARRDELRVGMMFLTRLPMGRVERTVPLSATAWSWPLAGVAAGSVMAGTALGLHAIGLSDPLSIGLGLAAGALATGALHEDGLSDLADGIGGGADATRRLEIMKDSRIGSYGSIALILLYLLRFLGWNELSLENIWASAVLVEVASRMALPLWSLSFRPARPNGLARSAAQMDVARTAFSLGLGVAICAALASPLAATSAITACLALQGAVLLYARKSLGGITGDVLGAAQVLGGLAALLTLGAL